jgi:small subunit ribosomal protein S8
LVEGGPKNMVMTDPIADMLTRIRNANQAKHEVVEMPASRLKLEILEVLKNEGYIAEYEKIEDGKQGVIKVTLKYVNKERVIKGIKRISKPGLRVYAKSTELPQVLNGLGVAIISTSNGVMTDREARKSKLGGEVIAFVW